MNELDKLFERLTTSESSYKVFNDLLDCLLFSMCTGHHPDHELKNPFADSKEKKLQLVMDFYKAMGKEAEGFEDHWAKYLWGISHRVRKGSSLRP